MSAPRHIQKLVYKLPLAKITGGSMDFSKVSLDDRKKIRHCAEQIHETLTFGLEGLGHIMWAASANEDAGMVADAWGDVSCLIYSIAELINVCKEIEQLCSEQPNEKPEPLTVVSLNTKEGDHV